MHKSVGFFASVLLVILSCSSEPQPIYFGEDNCSYCRMLISDSRYGAELVTGKGKAYKFDSVECLAAYTLEGKKGSKDTGTLWVVNFARPGELTPAEKASYLHSAELGSPMGMNLTAFAGLKDAESVAQKYAGEIVRWNDVKKIVAENWLEK